MKKLIFMPLLILSFSAMAQNNMDTVVVRAMCWVKASNEAEPEQKYIYRIVKGESIIGYLDENRHPIKKELVKEGWEYTN